MKELGDRAKERMKRARERADSAADSHRTLGAVRSVSMSFKEHGFSRESIYFAFHAFIAIFPLILIVTAVMGFVFHASEGVKVDIIDAVYDLLPDFDQAFKGMLDMMESGRFVALVLGVVIFLWTGIKAAEVLMEGLDRIWGGRKRKFFSRKLAALAVIAAFGTLTVLESSLNFMSSAYLPSLSNRVGRGTSVGVLFGGMALGITVGFLMYVIVFRLIPSRKPPVSAVVKGAAITAVVSYFIDYVFSFYFEILYDARFLYGTIGVMLGILLWLYVIAATTFAGALLVNWFARGKAPEPTAEREPGAGSASA